VLKKTERRAKPEPKELLVVSKDLVLAMCEKCHLTKGD
jgi:hypothetical protein